jgi:uncharacterized protein YndB with AHSA1/START domain
VVAVELPELRYEDGPTAEVDIVINAPPDAVWALITDIELPARFSTEFKGAEWLDGAAEPALGARFAGRNHHDAIGDWQTNATVVEYEPRRVFAWSIGNPEDSSATWRFSLEAEGDGTRLTQWMRMGPARSGINAAIDAMPDKESKILHRRLGEHRTNMLANLEGIKALAEA